MKRKFLKNFWKRGLSMGLAMAVSLTLLPTAWVSAAETTKTDSGSGQDTYVPDEIVNIVLDVGETDTREYTIPADESLHAIAEAQFQCLLIRAIMKEK